MFIIIVFRLGSDKLICYLFYCLSQGKSHGMCLLAWGLGWVIFHFRLFNSILIVNWISLFFLIFYIVLTSYVYYYCIWLCFNTLFLHRIFTVLSKGIRHGTWLLAWEFLLFFSVLHFAYASSFRLLLLRLCSNRCAEALVVYRNSLLNRLTEV